MIKRHDIAAGCEGHNIIETVVTTQTNVAHDLSGAFLHRRSQHPQTNTQCNSGLLHHAGELATANNPDGGKTRGNMGTVVAGHDERLVLRARRTPTGPLDRELEHRSQCENHVEAMASLRARTD